MSQNETNKLERKWNQVKCKQGIPGLSDKWKSWYNMTSGGKGYGWWTSYKDRSSISGIWDLLEQRKQEMI